MRLDRPPLLGGRARHALRGRLRRRPDDQPSFGSCEGGHHSDFERAPADPLTIADRVAEGDRLWLVAGSDSKIRAFTLRDGKFHGGAAGSLMTSAKSRAQLGALLRGAAAFRIDRMSETFAEQLVRERAEAAG